MNHRAAAFVLLTGLAATSHSAAQTPSPPQAANSAAEPWFVPVYKFASPGSLDTPLVLASDGNLYGTTGQGAPLHLGSTFFRLTPAGDVTILRRFVLNDPTDTRLDPISGLIQAADGNLYGFNGLSIVRLGVDGTATSLHRFGLESGFLRSVLQARDGNFYGTTALSGGNVGNAEAGNGTAFKMTPDGAVTTLHAFEPDKEGVFPAGLFQASDGSFYGFSQTDRNFVPARNKGLIFKMTAAGTVTVVHRFTGYEDGTAPTSLMQARDGNFYGTTMFSVFKMTPDGTVKTLLGPDPRPPRSLIQASDGNLYGTSASVHRITPDGAATVLHSFPRAGTPPALFDVPVAGLVEGRDGSLYGSTHGQGCFCNFDNDSTAGGSIFKIIPSLAPKAPEPSSRFSAIQTFPTAAGNTRARLIQTRDDGFAGVIEGKVFTMTGAGSIRALHELMESNGFTPEVGIVQARDGDFYGVGDRGGAHDHGLIFRITATGMFSVLYSFTGAADGARPSSIIEGRDGNFYGTSVFGGTRISIGGGAFEFGTIFKLTADGVLTTLHSFKDTDGSAPVGSLIQGRDGNFYGTTIGGGPTPLASSGTVFKMTPDGEITTLHAFTGGADGGSPGGFGAPLVEARDGSFYGTTTGGNAGTIYRIAPDGRYTTLPSFPANTMAFAILEARDGTLYGTGARRGTTPDEPSAFIFKITTDSAYSVVHTFTGPGRPTALVQARDGNLYGTNLGTIFRIAP